MQVSASCTDPSAREERRPLDDKAWIRIDIF
jgi:hypothetical protein